MTRGRFFFLLAMITLVFSILYVRTRHLLVQLSYDYTSAQKTYKELTRKKQELALELAVLKSPSRIESIAISKLGLERTASFETLTLKVKK